MFHTDNDVGIVKVGDILEPLQQLLCELRGHSLAHSRFTAVMKLTVRLTIQQSLYIPLQLELQ